MSRETRRVPLDFDAPLNKIWDGYRTPENLSPPKCLACDGSGYSTEARRLFDLWYGHAPFRPEDNGSTPLTPTTPAVRAFAERNVTRAPHFYGVGEQAITREATRLATLWNSMWSHHLNADDITALIDGDRLWDFTSTCVKGVGWRRIEPAPPHPTPEQVNTWAITSPGHDAINASIVVGARCEREGKPRTCHTCGGRGDVGTAEQRAAYEAWEPTDPPTGDGWQLWETTSEGSPISPVFATGDELAAWMSQNPCGFGGARITLKTAMAWVHGPGWAPSMVSSAVYGVEDGITCIPIEETR